MHPCWKCLTLPAGGALTSQRPSSPVSCSLDQTLWMRPACSGWMFVFPHTHWCFSMKVSYTNPAERTRSLLQIKDYQSHPEYHELSLIHSFRSILHSVTDGQRSSVPVVKRCLMGTSFRGAPLRLEVTGDDCALPRGLWGIPVMDREAWNTFSCCTCCWSKYCGKSTQTSWIQWLCLIRFT